MASVVKSFSIEGVDGYVVEVEIKITDGLPMFSIVINLAPSNIKKEKI